MRGRSVAFSLGLALAPAAHPCAAHLRPLSLRCTAVVPVDPDDDSSDSDDEGDEGEEGDDLSDDSDSEQAARAAAAHPATVKAAAKQAAKEAVAALCAERAKGADEAWEAMDPDERTAYIAEFFAEEGVIYAAVAKILENTRSVYLNPFLKETVRTECKDMVPSGDDLEAARRTYEASKKAFDDDAGAAGWPRMCPLLGTKDEFLPGFEDPSPLHGFTKTVLKIAAAGHIPHEDISPKLIGFVAYTADQVASIKKRKRGNASGQEVSASPCAAPLCHSLLLSAFFHALLPSLPTPGRRRPRGLHALDDGHQ